MATSIASSKPSTKASRSPTQPQASSKSSSVSSHLAMVELKSRILFSLSKLADRDTHQIAVDDLEKIISTLPPDGVPMLLNSLTADPPASPPPAPVRRESLRLLALLAASHPDVSSTHLPKIISYIARRLKDPSSDSSVRDACREAAGALAALYIRPTSAEESHGRSAVAWLFVKPLFEVMGEQSKVVQAGAAACLAKVVEGAGTNVAPNAGAGTAFQKLCPRVCKLLAGQSFQAKGALLSVVSSLAQVGAISPQNMQPLLQSVRECLESNDWATRKAAADTLSVLASCSSHLIGDGAASAITTLETCRFDKVKPVRDSMMEALSLWKKVAGKGEDGTSEDTKDAKNCESAEVEEKLDHKKSNQGIKRSESVKDSSGGSSPTGSDSISKGKGGSMPEKAVVLLKKKAPSLTDKELNPEFFQKLETRNPDDLLVEVVVPRRCLKSSDSQGDEEQELTDSDSRGVSTHNGTSLRESSEIDGNEKRPATYNRMQEDEFSRDRWTGQRGFRTRDSKTRIFDNDDRAEISQNDTSTARVNISRIDGHAEGSFINNKGNWLGIQRQLAQLERKQANLMNMLQDFMGGSHESMITLENRVRGLERVVEEMARDLAISSGRRGGGMLLGFEGSPGRPSSKYNGFHEYSSSKFGRAVDGRMSFAERFLSTDNVVSGVRGRESSWRSDSEAWDSYAHTPPRNGLMNSRRGQNVASFDSRLPRAEQDNGQVGNRRAWDKGQGPFRLGEGPSARSVWQASKDEATLEAIRVAGEDNDTSRTATQGSIRELDAEVLTDDNPTQERGPLWDSWMRAMDSLHVGDMDSAYADVLSTGDDMLLVKLMERSGPVMDQLSNEIGNEVLRVVGLFLLEQSLYDIALSWMQQLMDLIIENGADFLGIPLEGKREILFNLHEASGLELPEDWEGASPEQMMMQLASAWGINLQQLAK